MDEKDWIILRLAKVVADGKGRYAPDFISTVLWINRNIDMWLFPGAIEDVANEAKLLAPLVDKARHELLVGDTIYSPEAMLCVMATTQDENNT